MSDFVIKIEKVSKQYQLGKIGYGTLKHDIQSWMARVRGREDPNSVIGVGMDFNEDFWALKNIDIDIRCGESVGIIGKNGAGKSTLLKILSRITSPTTGEIKIKGKISSLLEVGTGFHPDLTGRENVFLNGAILGMKKNEIQKKMDEIISFSGIEKFIDTPVKRYSSGMYVRLAFAVAAHLDSDILILDEVLAVGDAEFQKKCLGKMDDVAKKQGRTVLFVSHNMGAINNLCNHTVVLSNGKVVFDGMTAESIRYYLQCASGMNENRLNNPIIFENDPVKPARLKKISLMNCHGDIANIIDYHEKSRIVVDLEIRRPEAGYYAIVIVHDALGNWLFLTADDDLSMSPLANAKPGSYSYELLLPDKLLKPGSYSIAVAIGLKNHETIDRYDYILPFEVFDNVSKRGREMTAYGYRKSVVVAPEIKWHLKKLRS